MSRLILVLLLLLGAATFACSGKADTDQQATTNTINNTDNSGQQNSGAGGSEQKSGKALTCPEGITWQAETPEETALGVICYNTELSLEFKETKIEKLGTDRVRVTVIADEFGCAGCPREVECVHEVYYQRQERLWKAQNVAYDLCVLSSASVSATETAEDSRYQAMFDSTQVALNSNQAEIHWGGGLNVPMTISPDYSAEGVRVWLTVQYRDGHIYTMESDDVNEDGSVHFTSSVPNQSSHITIMSDHGKTAKILSYQVVWRPRGCLSGNCPKPILGEIIKVN